MLNEQPSLQEEDIKNEILTNNLPKNLTTTIWINAAIRVAETVLVVVVCLVLYHFTVVQHYRNKVGVVDISEILTIKELQVTIKAMQSDASEEDKSRIFDEMTGFAKEIESAINEVQNDCACILMVRPAVVRLGTGGDDLTPQLKARLGMENITPLDLTNALRKMGGQGKAPQLENAKQ